MNKALRAMTILFAGLFFVVAIGTSSADAQGGPLREAVKRMDALNKSLASLKADVRLEEVNSQLGTTDVTIGKTSYLPKTSKRVMYARIDWTKPLEEHVVIIGDSYKLYRPHAGQFITGKVDKVGQDSKVPGNALAFMSMSKAQLEANYVVNYIGQEAVAGSQTWHLELVPKARTSYKTAELWVDSNGMPIQAKVIKPNN
ncbi:MAG TPA: outer membrane lipoprotein-sorting protein, partial [Pyrinomonadaceae bacterium]